MKIKKNNIGAPLVLSAVFFGLSALLWGTILSLLYFRLSNPLTFNKIKNILIIFNQLKLEYLDNGLELYSWQLAPFQNNAFVMLSDLKLNDKQIQTIENIFKNKHENLALYLKKNTKYYIISIIIFSLICLLSTSFLLEVVSDRCKIKDDFEEFDEDYDTPTSAEQTDRDDSLKNTAKERFHQFVKTNRDTKNIDCSLEDIEKIDFTEENLKSAILLKPLFSYVFNKITELSAGSNNLNK